MCEPLCAPHHVLLSTQILHLKRSLLLLMLLRSQACADGAELVRVQNQMLQQWEEERLDSRLDRGMPPSDDDESSEEESGEEGRDAGGGQSSIAGRMPPSESEEDSADDSEAESEAEPEAEAGAENKKAAAAAVAEPPISLASHEEASKSDPGASPPGSSPNQRLMSFIESAFPTRTAYEAWRRSQGGVASATPTALQGGSAATAAESTIGAISCAEGDAMHAGLLEVRQTGTAKGAGLFATRALEENLWLGDYTGEVLSAQAYLQRYPKEDAEYVLSANADYNVQPPPCTCSAALPY